MSSIAFTSKVSCAASCAGSISPAACASFTGWRSSPTQLSMNSTIRSRTRPGRVSISAATDAKKHPPGKTPRSRWARNSFESAHSLARPAGAAAAGLTTSASKTSEAVSMVASWSSSFDLKCA